MYKEYKKKKGRFSVQNQGIISSHLTHLPPNPSNPPTPPLLPQPLILMPQRPLLQHLLLPRRHRRQRHRAPPLRHPLPFRIRTEIILPPLQIQGLNAEIALRPLAPALGSRLRTEEGGHDVVEPEVLVVVLAGVAEEGRLPFVDLPGGDVVFFAGGPFAGVVVLERAGGAEGGVVFTVVVDPFWFFGHDA
jgi:hypothetical protein